MGNKQKTNNRKMKIVSSKVTFDTKDFMYYFLLVLVVILMMRENVMVSGVITKVSPNSAIISNNDAKFFVSLYERGECAGTVIGESFVITSARCVCNTNRIPVID